MSESPTSPVTTLNQLQHAASAYLRSARHQPVDWHEWGSEAFAKAQLENKPVLLDIGAVWCHWCHVMDRESYENPEIAAIINEHFVAIKVDRDERPDIDTRYQTAVASISGQGGWPLTAFLTPDGRPFFGGTYFPPADRHGHPGFPRVLFTMADAFATRPDEVQETAASVMDAIEHNETFSGRSGESGTLLLARLLESSVGQFDERNGGFGSQPKFPHAGALDLLIDAACRGGEGAAQAAHVAKFTLRKMAAGGMYDQLAGGFHRYSVDERWIVPHFEKMAYDNSDLLKTYAHACQAFAEPEFANVAKDIIRWMDDWLSDRVHGGFYASQDADDSLDDDGDYFTWTRNELQPVLSPEEFAVASKFYNVRPVGDMHHNPQKNVLHTPASLAAIAGQLQLNEAEAQTMLDSARQKMLAARLQRKTPFVDRTIYTGWNGMCITAYIAAGRILHLAEPIAFALKSLDRVLATAWQAGTLAHVVAYGEGTSATRIDGVLEDYGFLANAALDAWEATGDLRYFTAAQQLADTMIAKFYDPAGGFFDTENSADAIGALRTRRKPLQDAPTPAGNSLAATLLLRLATLTGDRAYSDKAQDTLETFAGIVEHFGLYAASYGLALRRAVEPALQVCIIGNEVTARELQAAAMRGYAVNKTVLRLTHAQLNALPPALAQTLPYVLDHEAAIAIVCRGNTCLPPVHTAAELVAVLTQ